MFTDVLARIGAEHDEIGIHADRNASPAMVFLKFCRRRRGQSGKNLSRQEASASHEDVFVSGIVVSHKSNVSSKQYLTSCFGNRSELGNAVLQHLLAERWIWRPLSHIFPELQRWNESQVTLDDIAHESLAPDPWRRSCVRQDIHVGSESDLDSLDVGRVSKSESALAMGFGDGGALCRRALV